MVVYRALPLKPTTPSGSTSVCAGTSEGYSSTSTNATSYQWYLDPVEAGTITNGTTSSPTITWSSSWTGDATITVKGIKDANESPLSDPLVVTVATVPTKPVITGDPFVKKGSSIIYTGSSIGAVNWTWAMTPNTLATATPSGQNVTLDFTSTGTFDLTAQAHNTCGDGIVSDNFNVEIVDISAIQAEITQLKADTTSKGIMYRGLISDLEDDKIALQNQVNQLVADTLNKGIMYRDIIADLENEKLDLQTQLATAISERDDALAANATLTTQLATVTQERDDALADVATLTTQLATVTQERDDALAANATLTTQLATVTQERDDALAANATLTTQLATVTQERDDALAANATLTTQLATVTQERDDALAANATLTTQLATVISERDDALAANALLQAQVSDLEQEVADLQAIIDGGMQDLLDQIDQLEADKIVLQGQVNSLTDQVATLTASNSSLQTQVNSLTDQVATLTASNEALQVQVDDLTGQVATLTASNSVLQGQVNSLTDQVASLTASNSVLQGQVDDLTDQVATLTASNSVLQGQVDDLTDQVATLTASNSVLQGQVDDLTTERDQALEKINEIATLLGVDVAEIESMINSLIAAYLLQFDLDNVTTHVINTEVGNFTISLYPNPNPGQVFIDCDQVMESLKVINTQGQTLLEKNVNGTSTSFIMYRNTFTASTIYFTVIKLQNGGTVTKKFIFSPK